MTSSNPSLETKYSGLLPDNPILRAYTAIAFALIVLSFAAVIIRLAQEAGLSSLTIAGLRLSGAALFLTPVVLRRYMVPLQQMTRKEVLLSATAGFFLAVHFTFMALSLEYTSVMVAQVLVNTGPLWVALLEMTFLKARLGRIVWIGLFVAVLGSLIIGVGGAITENNNDTETDQSQTTVIEETEQDTESEFGQQPLLGGVIGVIGAMFFGVYFTIGRKVRATVSLVPYVWLVYSFGGITGICIALISNTPILGYSASAYGYLLLLVLFPQLVGHSMFNYAVGFIPATLVTISSQALSVTSAVIAFFIFTEVPGIFDVVGSLVIAGGVIMAILGQSKKTATK